MGKGELSFSSISISTFQLVPRSVAACSWGKVLTALVCYERWAEMSIHGHKQEDTGGGGNCMAAALQLCLLVELRGNPDMIPVWSSGRGDC